MRNMSTKFFSPVFFWLARAGYHFGIRYSKQTSSLCIWQLLYSLKNTRKKKKKTKIVIILAANFA